MEGSKHFRVETRPLAFLGELLYAERCLTFSSYPGKAFRFFGKGSRYRLCIEFQENRLDKIAVNCFMKRTMLSSSNLSASFSSPPLHVFEFFSLSTYWKDICVVVCGCRAFCHEDISCFFDLRPNLFVYVWTQNYIAESRSVEISFQPSYPSRCKHFKFQSDQQKCQMPFCREFITNSNQNLILTTSNVKNVVSIRKLLLHASVEGAYRRLLEIKSSHVSFCSLLSTQTKFLSENHSVFSFPPLARS